MALLLYQYFSYLSLDCLPESNEGFVLDFISSDLEAEVEDLYKKKSILQYKIIFNCLGYNMHSG